MTSTIGSRVTVGQRMQVEFLDGNTQTGVVTHENEKAFWFGGQLINYSDSRTITVISKAEEPAQAPAKHQLRVIEVTDETDVSSLHEATGSIRRALEGGLVEVITSHSGKEEPTTLHAQKIVNLVFMKDGKEMVLLLTTSSQTHVFRNPTVIIQGSIVVITGQTDDPSVVLVV